MNRTHNPLIAMNRNERSVYSVFSDRIEAYSVIELTEIHGSRGVMLAYGVNDDGYREILGLMLGDSESEAS